MLGRERAREKEKESAMSFCCCCWLPRVCRSLCVPCLAQVRTRTLVVQPRHPLAPASRSRTPKPLLSYLATWRAAERYFSRNHSLSLSLSLSSTHVRARHAISLARVRSPASPTRQALSPAALSRSLALSPYRPVPQPISSLTPASAPEPPRQQPQSMQSSQRCMIEIEIE